MGQIMIELHNAAEAMLVVHAMKTGMSSSSSRPVLLFVTAPCSQVLLVHTFV
jgi:hypothetical protein